MPNFVQVPISAACSNTPACNLVSNGWNSMVNFADQAYLETYQFLGALYASIDPQELEVPTASLVVEFPENQIGSPAIPQAPDAPDDLDLNLPTTPTAPTLAPVAGINIPAAPEFLAEFPTITLPAAPGGLTAPAPGSAPTFSAPTLPVAPDTVIPDAPTLRSLNIPDAPALDLPEFSATAPDDLVDPFTPTITFSEDLYDSAMLQAVQAKLLDAIQNGDGGLNENIVDHIWQRERERELKEYNRARDTALDEFASRGFDMPPGALQTRLRMAERENITASITMAREKAIENAQRAYDYLKFAIQNIVGLEGQLMSYTNSLYQRLLQVQTSLLDAGVAIYGSKIQAYSARVQAYSVYASVFQTRVQAELAKIEVFRAQIEAQKAIGELNIQDLEAYKTAIQAVETIVDIYKTEMQAAQVEADVQRVSIEAFKSEVDAYRARVEAKSAEYESYAQQINGELSKVRLYESAAGAYNSEVNGYRALVDAESARARTDIEVNRAYIDEYQGRVQAFRALIDAESSRIQAKVQAFGAEVQGYQAQVSGEVSKVDAERQNLLAQVEVASKQADLGLKEAEVNIERASKLLSLYNDTLKTGATVSAQLTASAMDAVNLSASISGQDSTVTNL